MGLTAERLSLLTDRLGLSKEFRLELLDNVATVKILDALEVILNAVCILRCP